MQEDKSMRIVPYVRICVGTNAGLLVVFLKGLQTCTLDCMVHAMSD